MGVLRKVHKTVQIEDIPAKMNRFVSKEGKSLLSKVQYTGNLKRDTKRAVDLIGGFKKIIKPGDKVWIKPNYNTANPFPASTDINFLKAVIELVKETGASEIVIAESSGPGPMSRQVMKDAGVFSLAKELGCRVVVLDEEDLVPVDFHSKLLGRLDVFKFVIDAPNQGYKIIFLPCLKTHFCSKFTISLKMAVALFKKFDRIRWLHMLPPSMMPINLRIAEMNRAVYPDLVILDARKCFVTRGPNDGLVKRPHLLMASGDRIAIDVEGLRVLKQYHAKNQLRKDVWKFGQIRRAVELGLGARDDSQIKVVE